MGWAARANLLSQAKKKGELGPKKKEKTKIQELRERRLEDRLRKMKP